MPAKQRRQRDRYTRAEANPLSEGVGHWEEARYIEGVAMGRDGSARTVTY